MLLETVMDVLLKFQEKRENIYTKKDLIIVQSAFFFLKKNYLMIGTGNDAKNVSNFLGKYNRLKFLGYTID